MAISLALVFAKFAEMQSVRQVHLWFRHERVPLPAVTYGAEGRLIEWKLPVYNTILHILTNPIYAGAYAFGRPSGILNFLFRNISRRVACVVAAEQQQITMSRPRP
jgi:hypothetical protein